MAITAHYLAKKKTRFCPFLSVPDQIQILAGGDDDFASFHALNSGLPFVSASPVLLLFQCMQEATYIQGHKEV